LVVIAILIAGALFGVGRIIIRRTADGNQWLTKALTICLLLHLVCAPLEIWVVDHLYGGIADYNRYDAQGAALAQGFRHFNFSLGAANAQGIVGDGSVSIVAGVVFAIIGVNQLGAFFVFAFLSFIGVLFFFRAFTITFGGAGSRRYGYMIFYLPSIVFWTADVSKEAIMMFLLGMTAYGSARILAHRGGYFLVIASSAGGVFIRPNEVLLALGGFVMAMIVRPANRNAALQGSRRAFAVIVLASMLGVAIFITVHFVPGGSLSLTQLSKNNNTGSGAGFGSSNLAYSPSILKYPNDLYAVLIDPLPFNAHGGGQLFSAAENTVLLGLVFTSLRQLRYVPRAALARTYIVMCAFFTLSFVYAFASLGNAGLIDRERVVMLPFFLMLLCIPRGPRGHRPRYEWELPRRVRNARRNARALPAAPIRPRRAARA
jgi:hypothetical protein